MKYRDINQYCKLLYISAETLTPTFLSRSPTIFIADILAGGVSGMFCPPLDCCTGTENQINFCNS
jgi:hypothetical protein